MAYGARALGSRRVRSSRRSHALPGRTGEPSTGVKGPRRSRSRNGEAREMRDAATVLEIIRERGRRDWVTRMASCRRKALVVCRVCHEDIHAGRPTRTPR
ncbi:hypothetical protein ABZ897_53635 [Nonomuraea sp. NPDC046802]|uniref:hypothetical protein n=1 Tax=Nonomuraea sp. NPDC046802 TaxID=3154919 RepID=UPI0033E35F2F